MATTASKPALLSNVVPLYAPGSINSPTKQQDLILPHQYPSALGSQFDNQASILTTATQTSFYTGQEPGSNQPSNIMMSQVPPHQYDHHLNQPSNHHRHVSNASSISSLSSGHHSYDTSNYPSSTGHHDPFAVPASYAGSVSAGAAFGGVPVSAESFHQYSSGNHSQHQRASSTSSVSSPFTEATSVSEGNSPEGLGPSSAAGVPGGRKVSQAQHLRRARAHASPYAIRTDQLSWNGGDPSGGRSAASSSSSMMRSASIASDTPSNTEDELVEILRSHSRETSVSDWGSNPSQHARSHHQTGIGAAGAYMDPYATVASVHGHGGAFGPTMVNINGNAGLGGMVAGGMVGGVGGGMVNTALVGGMGAQMGRMTLDSSETYEALSHHIRTAVTTSASDRARQAFVQAWLNSSYISYTDGNVSRQGLYGSYLRICQQYDIKPINSASFGKAVRQCFPNIKTRRLGVRGNSKYHYCGIRPATAKEAEILMNLSRNEQPEPSHGSHNPFNDEDIDSDCSSNNRVNLSDGGVLSIDSDHSQPQTPRTARPNMASLARLDTMSSGHSSNRLDDVAVDSNGSDISRTIPFPNLEENLALPSAINLDHCQAKEFWDIYLEHSRGLLDSVKSYRFDQFELSLRTFWAGLDASGREVIGHPVMMSLVYRADAVVYDEVLDYLQSQTLSPMPQQAFSSLRQLAQSMEQVIIVALEGYPGTFVGPKIELAARFGHLIVRHLGVCQLAQALSGIFGNAQSLKEMAEAWDGIDFEAVRNQAALVTNCQHDILGHCFDDFRQVISNSNATIDHLIQFVECTYERCLQPSLDGERSLSPRSLLVRWCFVSSQLIRDLTLRSAASFGSFQIVNLFFDEWLGFKVLRKVALHVAAVAASVDATSSDALPPPPIQLQPQQQQLNPLIYLPSGQASSYQSFSVDKQALDHQQSLPTQGTTPTPLTTTHQPNQASGGPPATRSEGFLFSPTTTQAFAVAQQQAAGSAGPSPNGPVASSANFSSSSSSNLNDERSPHSQPRASSPALSATKSTSPSSGANQNETTANHFDHQAFNDFMDVRTFVTSSTQEQPDHSQNLPASGSPNLSVAPQE